MICKYAFDIKNMLHLILFNDMLLAFDISGKLRNQAPANYYNFREVDVVSVLQEHDMCEAAVLSSNKFSKSTPSVFALNKWLSSLPVDKICVLQQRVAPDGYKTLYIFQKGKLAPFLPIR